MRDHPQKQKLQELSNVLRPGNSTTLNCSKNNFTVPFPFLSSSQCSDTYIIPPCETLQKYPIWPAFTNGALTNGNRSMQTFVTKMTATYALTGEEDIGCPKLGLIDTCHGYLNITWRSDAPSGKLCDALAPVANISDYIPGTINLTQFADSAFDFDSSNVILLFDCDSNLINSSPYKDVLEENSDACSFYSGKCNQTTRKCYQYNVSKELALKEVMSVKNCSNAMFFIRLNGSSKEFDWTAASIRLSWVTKGSGPIVSLAHSCSDCVNTSKTCGYEGETLQCFCSNGTLCPFSSSSDAAPSSLPTSTPRSPAKKKIFIPIIIGVASSLVLTAILLAIPFYIRKKSAKKACISSRVQNTYSSWMKRPSFLSRKQDSKLLEMPYTQLVHATDSFADKNVLGNGGFGDVYRGVLENGCRVAIKRLHHDNSRRLEHFYNEMKVLSDLEHPNLVRLFGFCACEDKRELLLVFEYASQGTVSDHLHGVLGPPLSWNLRLNIACETAGALSYLHHSIEPPIYHRDVKTANILLDDEFHAKLADFGLSKLVPPSSTHVSTGPQGTPGYLDPEYHQCYQLTEKSDVYSFGVVLMELLSGQLAVDLSRGRGVVNLSTLAMMKIQCGQLDELIDPSLEMKKDPRVENSIKKVAELAFQCLHEFRDDRPSMKSVAETLVDIQREYERKSNTHATGFLVQKRIPSSPSSILFSSGSSSHSSNVSSS
ncbi:hypothetical protein KP509_13G047500 [Ceratopteris richardii]|uniref:Protein kinase domain-containing protein n=1 Tax=Ceratopteris richardii TaxID=49495 RepID=A0A8T2TKT1_CERRI|nr:hypothetical protein KP509_13G047500 [Ceratopteris richardii]KAH7421241.1 hypothetical protein KP509_13G047500 [Ceratopteris richardii]